MDLKPKIIFFGTPEFAVPALQSLIDGPFEIAAVVTRPDKPIGRQQQLTPPPVKVLADKHNIPVSQPVKFTDEALQRINALQPDLFVIVAYGKILPQALLEIPGQGSVNLHPSLLPKYRGPSPLQAQILNDEKTTGVTIMLIDEEMDHGPILKQYEYPISKPETYEILGKELFEIGAKHLPEVIKKYMAGEIRPQAQEHSQATLTKLIKKQDGEINWDQPADSIERMTRAYWPWPGAYGRIKNYELGIKIIKAHVSDEKPDLAPGSPFIFNGYLAITCGANSVLIIDELQPAGKKQMTSQEFLRGHQLPTK